MTINERMRLEHILHGRETATGCSALLEKSTEGKERGGGGMNGERYTGRGGNARGRKREQSRKHHRQSSRDDLKKMFFVDQSFIPNTQILPFGSVILVVSPTFRSAADVAADMFELRLPQSSQCSGSCRARGAQKMLRYPERRGVDSSRGS